MGKCQDLGQALLGEQELRVNTPPLGWGSLRGCEHRPQGLLEPQNSSLVTFPAPPACVQGEGGCQELSVSPAWQLAALLLLYHPAQLTAKFLCKAEKPH